MILFGWDLNHPCILIDFEEFFEASNLRNLATDADWEAHWSCVLELNLKDSWNFIILFDRRNFNSNLNLGSFFGSNFESDLFEVFISLVTSDWEDVLIEVIKLLIVALGDDSEKEGLSLLGLWDNVVCKINWYIDLFDRAWIKCGFSELNDLTIDVDEMTCLRFDFFEFFFWRLFLLGLSLLLLFGFFCFLRLSLLWSSLL